jgi:hypothetical protein
VPPSEKVCPVTFPSLNRVQVKDKLFRCLIFDARKGRRAFSSGVHLLFLIWGLWAYRAKVGTETAYKGMQGSQGISEMRTAGDQYRMHDYMQTMAMEKRIKQDGLRWQRDAAAAPATAVSSLQTVGCLVQESGSFKVHQLKKKRWAKVDQGKMRIFSS